MLRDWILPRSIATQVKWSDALDDVQMEKDEEPMRFFSRVDKVVGIQASLRVQKSIGDVNRQLVRVLTSDYEMKQRSLLYRDEINRAKIENIVRQRHLGLPVSTGGNVGQALWTNGEDNGGSGRNRNNRKTRNSNNSSNRRDRNNSINGSDRNNSSNNSNGSNGSNNSSNNNNSSNSSNSSNIPQSAYSNISNNSSNNSNSSNIPQSPYDIVRGKCIRCLKPGHRWQERIAYVPPVVGTTGNGQYKASENVCCLASVLLGTSDGSSKENTDKNTARTWVADISATYHMTRSVDMMHDIRPTSD